MPRTASRVWPLRSGTGHHIKNPPETLVEMCTAAGGQGPEPGKAAHLVAKIQAREVGDTDRVGILVTTLEAQHKSLTCWSRGALDFCAPPCPHAA